MSLLHNPTYTFDYDEEDDRLGLQELRWSQFMCKCGRCDVKSGKNYMERLPVLILDDVSREERGSRMDIELGYVCKWSADNIHMLPSKDPHRVGLAIKIRVINPMKRLKIVRGLILRSVTRIALSQNSLYFDTDDLKGMALYLR